MKVEGYYTVEEAAQALGVTVWAVYKAIESNPPRLDAIVVNRARLIPAAEIKRFQAERRKPGRPRKQDD